MSCKYCYYFNRNDYLGHQDREDYSPIETTEKLVTRLKETLEKIYIEDLQIVLHGGEPLMMKPEQFERHLKIIRHELPNIRIGIQTNGVLLNNAWCELFDKYKVGVGISIDGNKKYHDKNRVTKGGKGSYDLAIKGLRAAQESWPKRQIGVLSVLNHEFDYKSILKHFNQELNCKNISLLMPDRTADEPIPKYIENKLSSEIINCFEYYMENDIAIKMFDRLLENFQEYKVEHHIIDKTNSNIDKDHILNSEVITVHTDGAISYYDMTYPSIVQNLFSLKSRSKSIFENNLSYVLFSPEIINARKSYRSQHADCKKCKYSVICINNPPAYRASKNNGYNNKSVYCSVYYNLYEHVIDFLCNNGYPVEKISEVLGENYHLDNCMQSQQ
ncbi:radical SAM protein [Vibrio natriegens]|uniref:radical SAM protein n=1 Tax=Vibrio natriegens TaxID=691 RepID=UPI00355861E7